jgi:hypothetical protein
MSALGKSRHDGSEVAICALPPKADIAESDCHVRYVPQADITAHWQLGDSVRDHACKVASALAALLPLIPHERGLR